MAKLAAAVLARAGRAETVAVTDRDLLRRFAEAADQAAFAAVVRRHSGMVFGVCRRLLASPADAEDATQAVFLVLAKKAAGTRWQPSVANWLYSTARKVAHNARLAAARRAKREGAAAVPEAVPPADSLSGRELVAVLDEELDRLPPRYREPLVLCYLEGLTRDQAAARLGQTVPALNKQLERGRKKLADALTARGCALGVLLLAAVATSSAGASPPKLLESILATAGGTPSGPVAALARGVAMNGTLARMKLVLAAAVGVAAVGLGVGAVPPAAPPAADKMEKMKKPEADAKVGPKTPETKERTIAGMVLTSDGKPVVADLALHWGEGTVQPLGKTKADGTFRLTVPFQKKGLGGDLVATAAGCGPDFHHHGYDWLPPSITPTAELAFKLPKERTIKGRVINQEGKPVSGADVAAHEVSAYYSAASLDAKLKTWAERADGNPLHGDRGMQYPKAARAPSATTDKDGRFELAGYGVGQTVKLKVGGDGIAVKGLVFVNRDGFAAAPLVEAAVRNAGKNHKFNPRWVICGPDFTAVVEPEKLLRGTVTDPDGKPQAGVRVQATRTTSTQLTDHWYWHEATTDKDGRYEIRGLRKYPAYTVTADPPSSTGLLYRAATASDSVGYEPVTLDVTCARGVVVRGTVTNKATGQPIRSSNIRAEVLKGNPFAGQFPALDDGPPPHWTDDAGKFRIVTIPGPVLLIATGGSKNDAEYKPPVADPNHPHYFWESEGGLLFKSYSGRDHLNGCWCQVLNATAAGDEVVVKIELEPATKTAVKVVAADGTPLKGTQATGVQHVEYANPTAFPDTDIFTVLNLDAKKERLLAVVHAERKLVGTLMLTAGTKDPVVKLGEGGAITGRAVGTDGKPLTGLAVTVTFTHRQATEAFEAFHKGEPLTTDANGEFRVEGLFPGREFKLYFTRKGRSYGLEVAPAPAYTLAEPGETRKAGQMVLLIDHK